MTAESEMGQTPRLCVILKSDNFNGYGFNLHAEKGRPGQYIGQIDDNSPALAGGLKQGDRILEVNGVSIANETHKQVVSRIKALSAEVRLLVVDGDPKAIQNLQAKAGKSATNSSSPKAVPPPTVPAAHSPTKANNTTTTVPDSKNGNNDMNNSSPVAATTPVKDNSKELSETDLNLKLSAAELRAKIAGRKSKIAVKQEGISIQKKYDIIQKL